MPRTASQRWNSWQCCDSQAGSRSVSRPCGHVVDCGSLRCFQTEGGLRRAERPAMALAPWGRKRSTFPTICFRSDIHKVARCLYSPSPGYHSAHIAPSAVLNAHTWNRLLKLLFAPSVPSLSVTHLSSLHAIFLPLGCLKQGIPYHAAARNAARTTTTWRDETAQSCQLSSCAV